MQIKEKKLQLLILIREVVGSILGQQTEYSEVLVVSLSCTGIAGTSQSNK
jgi:hypothetical protein